MPASSIIINLPPLPVQRLDSVETIPLLRGLSSIEVTNGQDISVDGTSEVGDGGGGLFVWAELSTEDDDGATIIKPNDVAPLAAGRWILTGSAQAALVIDALKTSFAAPAGGGLVGLNQLLVYPENSLGSKLTRTLSAKDGPFNAKGDGSTDDLAALNSWASHAGPGTQLILPASGAYNISAPMSAITGHDIDIRGEGNSTLRYVGASPSPGNLMAIGDVSNSYNHIKLAGFRIISGTVLSGGFALWVNKCRNVHLDVILGDEYDTYSLFRGLSVAGVDMRFNSTSIYALNTLLTVGEGYEYHCQNMYLKGNQAARAGYGIHVGGGVGGFYTEQVTQQFNDVGIMVDTAINGIGNLQIFAETGTFDVNTTAGMKINDGTSNPIGKSIKISNWLASTVVGANLHIQNWNTGVIAIGDVICTNGASSGIYIEDPNCFVTIGSGAKIYNNAGYGVDAAVPVGIGCLADLGDNTLGGVSSNVNIQSVVSGAIKSSQDPTKGWARDATFNTVPIANGANVKLAGDLNTSGEITIVDDTSGHIATYLVGGGSATLVSTTNTSIWVAATTTPAAGRASINSNGSNGYNIYNNLGGTRTFRIDMSKVRG